MKYIGHREYKKRTLEEKFWKKVIKDEINKCWIWVGARHKFGYGHMHHLYKDLYAHHISWQIHYGQIPEKMWVLHKCDNPPCVNPNHLWLGTAIDNVKDRERKGRGALSRGALGRFYGELHPSSKLTNRQVSNLRKSYIPLKVTAKMLAKRYKISIQNTKSILYKYSRTRELQ